MLVVPPRTMTLSRGSVPSVCLQESLDVLVRADALKQVYVDEFAGM